MKRRRFKLKSKIYPILWSGIIVISIYLILRFAALYFSDNIGQAKISVTDAVVSKLCMKAFEDGYSLIPYTEAGGDQFDFPVSIADKELAVQRFTSDPSVMTTTTENNPFLNKEKGSGQDDTAAIQTLETASVYNELGIYQIDDEGSLSLEYILTNGAVINSDMASHNTQTEMHQEESDQLQVGYSQGEVYYEETEDSAAADNGEAMETINTDRAIEYNLEQLKDISFLVRNCYIVDSSTKVTENLFDAEKLLKKDMTMKQKNDAPQILIYHTHSQEGYIDSRPGNSEDTVVGVGSYLTQILKEKYGYNVIHDTTKYDMSNGTLNRNSAYDRAEDGLKKILQENPSIEVMIDLHRDEGNARTIQMNGKKTANVMLFNGLSRDQNGPITYLDNPNLQDNLAFSLQLQLKSRGLYPGLFYRNYLKSYRFNLHLRPKSLLMELGTNKNTVESAYNAMEPFAEVLDNVLQGK